MLNYFKKRHYISCLCHHCSTFSQKKSTILVTKEDTYILDTEGFATVADAVGTRAEDLAQANVLDAQLG